MTGGPPPRAGICSVGSELVRGELADTNGAWLAARLLALGWEPALHVVVGDEAGEIAEAVRFLAGRCERILVGGGLGPTSDDRTREALAAAAGVQLEHRDELEAAIRARFQETGSAMPDSNLRQALLPAGAQPLLPVGTAPGFRLRLAAGGGEVVVDALPGVPWEARSMFERDVEPQLAAAGGSPRVVRVVRVGGRSEARVAEDVEAVLEALGGDVDVSYRAGTQGLEVRVSTAAEHRGEAEEHAAAAVEAIQDALGRAVVGVDEDSLDAVVVRRLAQRGETVAAAESATAGLVCARLAEVPGASRVLRGGAVVYATATKRDVLGVDAELLAREGPVSRATTEQLARRVREVFGADWGLGAAGVAGPDPQDGREVGTAIWAVAGPDGGVEAHERQLRGDRASIRQRLATATLEGLRRRLLAR